MEIYFRDHALEDSCRSREGRVLRWGAQGLLVGRRLAELAALDNISDAAWIPGVRVAEIGPDRFEYICPHGVRLLFTRLDTLAIDNNGRVRFQRIVLEDVAVNNAAHDFEGELA